MRPIIKELVLGATAGNVVGSMTNDTKMDIELMYGFVSLTTDATVANRLVSVGAVKADATLMFDAHAAVPLTASLTSVHLEFMQAVSRETAIVNNSVVVGIPERMIIPAGGTLRVNVTGGVATDSYTARFTCKEAIA